MWYVPEDWAFTYENGRPIGANEPTELNLGDQSTLTHFLNWVFRNFPADYYGLILWNHGGGWQPRSRERAGIFWLPSKGLRLCGKARPIRGICWDETDNGDFLTTKEMANAIAGSTRGFVEVVGFDACLMQMLEVAYEAKDVAKYMVGSEEVIGGIGWAYHVILSQISRSSTPLDVAQTWASQSQLTEGGAEIISALDLSRVEELASAVSALGKRLETLLKNEHRYQEILHTKLHSLCFETNSFLDLLDFCRWVERMVKDGRARSLARRVKALLERAIVAKANTSKYEGAGGLSIYLPTNHDLYWQRMSHHQDVHPNYTAQNFSFCLKFDWDEFVNSFLEASYPDRYEPNDAPDKAFDLGIIPPDYMLDLPEANLDDGSADWFKFTLPNDRSREQVEIFAWCTGRNADTVISIYDSLQAARDDKYLATDDDGLRRELKRAQCGAYLRLSLRGGTYYLKVAPKGRELGQGYALQIKVGKGQYVSVSSVGPRLLAVITRPSKGELLTGEVEVEGTAYSLDLEEWRLEYGQGRYPTFWSLIARGERPVYRGSLATWDTSTLPDGTYTLRLTVRDRSGEEAEARVVVSLDNTYPSVVGVVSDAETGEPLAGAVVEAFGPEGFRAVAYTDPQGNYVLRGLKPARYTLRASALGYKEAEQTLQIAMKPDEWRVDFALEKAPPRRPGAISGLVYVSVGREPLGNAEVTVSFGGRVVARATTSSEVTTKAGYKFNYRIEGLQPGRYEVSVSRPGFTPFIYSKYC